MSYRNCCHASGCKTRGCMYHYCRNCGNTDSDHRSSSCPYIHHNNVHTIGNPSFQQFPQLIIQPIRVQHTAPIVRVVQPVYHTIHRCRAIGCTQNHTAHTCRNCQSYDSTHVTANCPFVRFTHW